MNAQWYLAKHVRDLARGEVENVGLVLVQDGHVLGRFRGERAAGTVDLRTVRGFGLTPAYREWVTYWRNSMQIGPDHFLSTCTHRSADDNYYLELAGEVVVGDAPARQFDMLEQLYSRLVASVDDEVQDEDPVTVSLRLAQARLPRPVQVEPTVNVIHGDAIDTLVFDYRYDNGVPHFMRKVSVGKGGNTAWNNVHAAAWTFQTLSHSEDEDLREARCIALVRTPEQAAEFEPQYRLLEQYGDLVSVANPDEAADRLVELLEPA
jgi:hypothetical protein